GDARLHTPESNPPGPRRTRLRDGFPTLPHMLEPLASAVIHSRRRRAERPPCCQGCLDRRTQGTRMRKRFLLGLLALVAACSSKPETPLTGTYVARIGQVSFDTTATADMILVGTAPFSGDIVNAGWKRKGDTLTITTRPKFKGKYQVTYTFDVLEDGAHLVLREMDVTTEETGKTETTVMPDDTRADATFNKRN